MHHRAPLLAAATAGLLLAGCEQATQTGNDSAPAEAADKAGDKTLAAGLDGRFAEAAKAAGLDPALGGPGPYTVLAPSDAAFEKMPAGALDTLMKPDARAQLTEVLTYHVLPGVMLAADIAKAVDNGGGKAVLATMGGGTLTATRDGDTLVIADQAGAKARVTQADDKRSNGVVHHVDTVLMPS